jgi:hypothetical protein
VSGAIAASAYTALLKEAGFDDDRIVDTVDADDVVPPQPGNPRIFSARITATKPA